MFLIKHWWCVRGIPTQEWLGWFCVHVEAVQVRTPGRDEECMAAWKVRWNCEWPDCNRCISKSEAGMASQTNSLIFEARGQAFDASIDQPLTAGWSKRQLSSTKGNAWVRREVVTFPPQREGTWRFRTARMLGECVFYTAISTKSALYIIQIQFKLNYTSFKTKIIFFPYR